MGRLLISDFSCITHADITMTDINIIIGPQGSGKSVSTKLFNFFTEMLSDFYSDAENDLSLSEYKKRLNRRFILWFPPAAWGGKRFNISYQAGNFSVRVLRRMHKGELSDEVSIKISKWFDDAYEFALNLYREASIANRVNQSADDYSASRFIEMGWRIRQKIMSRIQDSIDDVYYSQQTFIPAGRAFFTSIGRLVAGIEHAGSLDPVTLKFAKVFAGWRDRSGSQFARRVDDPDLDKKRTDMMNSLFGGSVSTRRESEFIEMSDGRRVPFSSLSSGQQELMPIWYFLDNIILSDAAIRRSRGIATPPKSRHLIYIEEPEAHLFPSAQSALMEALIGAIIGNRGRRHLVLTTHSPYIMTKLNVFLKAGQLARRRKRNTYINSIVPRECWVRRNQIAAWCIEDGEFKSIIDEDEGLIDAQYLDEISDTLSDDFNSLLDIEESIS